MNQINNTDLAKRFWLFAGHNYYPGGGAKDFISSFDSLDEAVKYAKDNAKTISERVSYEDYIWYNVLDIETGKIAEGYSDDEEE